MKATLHTTEGDITLRLYDETPLHRDNFIRLAKEGYFDGTLFHRVIRDFMIQGGDPDSVDAPAGKTLGTGGPDYTIPAEIDAAHLFHRRGAVCAARQADEVNPEKASSGSQFYIVWGQTYKPAQLKQMERQMAMQQEQQVANALMAERRSDIMQLRRNRDREGLAALQEELTQSVRKRCSEMGAPKFTPEQTEAYTTEGGTPFLDGAYTVFGQVEEGLPIVERIQQTETRRDDRPVKDIKVLTVEVIEA